MTTWQDQQPTSRRALRESERAHSQATINESVEEIKQESAADQQIWSDNSIAEPLNYVTQARQPGVEPEQPLRRPRQSGSSRNAPESPGYRVREFAPESRGSSFSSTQPAPWTPPAAGSEDLNYRTSVNSDPAPNPVPNQSSTAPPILGTPAGAAAPPATHVEPPSPTISVPEEHTLTRREIRERRNAATDSVQAPSAPETPTSSAPASAPPAQTAPAAQPAPALGQPPVVPPAMTRRQRRAPAAPPNNQDHTQSAELAAAMNEFDSRLQAQSIPTLVEPPMAPGAPASPIPPRVPEAPAPPVAPAARAPQPIIDSQPPAPMPSAAAAPVAPEEPLREVISAPEVYSAPAGHWSNQEAEANQGMTGPHKRDLSSIDAITTSALVLPNFSVTGPVTGPVSETGQVLMTGSIELPRSLGITGLHPSRYDRSDIDDIIDAADREDAAPDSAPVRAVRAVSTYTSSQGIISMKKPRESNLPMVLSITAGVMMVGVVVLVVVGMIFKIF